MEAASAQVSVIQDRAIHGCDEDFAPMPERARVEFLCRLARHAVLGGFGGRPSITHELKFTHSPIEPVQRPISDVIHPGYVNITIG